MFLLRSPNTETLQAILTTAKAASFSYTEVGATAGGALPDGYHHDRSLIDLGHGPDRFDRAVAGLRSWQMHVRSGLQVFPEGQDLAPAVTVLSVVRFGLLTTVAPCRVVYVIDEPDRFGFAYGTLAGHPEQGEEAFVVERTGRFKVTAFSRPKELLARLGGPVSRKVQQRATTAYLDAMRDIAEEGDRPANQQSWR